MRAGLWTRVETSVSFYAVRRYAKLVRPRQFATKGHRPVHVQLPGGVMNQSEETYAEEVLNKRLLIGTIIYWGFEQIRFRLGSGAWYTPDFFVVTREARIEIHEFKGHWEEAARVRVKTAAADFPWFEFIAVTKKRGNRDYTYETIKSHHSYTKDTLHEVAHTRS